MSATTSPPAPTSASLFGFPVVRATIDDVVSRCDVAVASEVPLTIGVVNAAKVVNCRRDAVLRDAVAACDPIIADGMSVVWASRVLGRPLPERVTGIDLFQRLVARAAEQGYGVYLLGARPEVLAATEHELRRRHPDLVIAGSHHGYYEDHEVAAIAADIRASGADLLFVAMTSPRKERFLRDWRDDLGVDVAMGVGGSFDVVAGEVRRAPDLWQRLGLEWLYRVLQEPRRLWKRYLTTNTAFVLLTLRELIRPTPPYRTGR